MFTYKEDNFKVPVNAWLNKKEDIEEGALKQIANLASLPFIFKHLAIMPDTHQGYGMPIGGVLATEGVVIPNAVGVDIGCFTGDTKISLLNGTQKTLKKLVEEKQDVYVYSLDEKLNIVAGKATPKLTRKNAELIEVVISGGETIRCTPDHQFMLLNGQYKEAKDLKSFDSLMPLYRTYESKDGYEHIRAGRGASIATNRLVAKQFLGKPPFGCLTHHIDEHWFNNYPTNIEYKDKKLHSRDHRISNPIFGTECFKQKRLNSLKKNGFYNKKFYPIKKETALNNLKKLQKSPKWKKASKEAGKRNGHCLSSFNQINNSTPFTCECGRVICGKGGFVRHQNNCSSNHKVLFTKKLLIRENVYCLTVEKYHNFALAAGVFVHNCGMCAVKTSLKVEQLTQEILKKIMSKIREVVPVGMNHHKVDKIKV